MCGLFGFIGEALDLAMLKTAALRAGTRGPHAWGMAWVDSAGELGSYRAAGPIEHATNADWMRVQAARQLIGCCRLATSGDWHVMHNNQPLIHNDVALVHNGNIYNAAELCAEHGYTPQTANDSEALLAVIASTHGSMRERCQQAMTARDQRSPLAALVLSTDGELLALRDRHPLTITHAEPANRYLCSRTLGATSLLLPDLEVVCLTSRGT